MVGRGGEGDERRERERESRASERERERRASKREASERESQRKEPKPDLNPIPDLNLSDRINEKRGLVSETFGFRV